MTKSWLLGMKEDLRGARVQIDGGGGVEPLPHATNPTILVKNNMELFG